ncbi:MAG: chromosomal replication initiator protein DnaA [Vallitalea sp.]|nr:chromosomal replication initiator protein DnaA [Vallitalea sp.]
MSHSVIEKWDKVQELLRDESDISKISYKTFLENLEPIKVQDDTIIIKTDDEIGRDYIERKYTKSIIIAIKEIVGEIFDIKFILPSELEKENKEDKKMFKKQPTITNEYNNLNSRYTFDTFVVGNNNKLAHAAALAVAESPAEAYNPLFIYGGVGLGKTHLMHSIAHFILSENSQLKVLYVSSEKFTNELIKSIRDDKNEEFRQKYRNIDVLLVDDIQFIAGKERTQEEFFHTFNTLYEAKKQIIISSDRPPKEIETLEERLRSRFEWGLIADIQAPDYETRVAILQKRAELENLNLPNDVIQYVATNIKSNIRELEGGINKIIAYSTLVHKELTKELAEDALKDLITPDKGKEITPEFILEIVSEHYNLNPADIISKKRPREIAYPRQVVMYLSRTLTDMSLPKIGQVLGKRDHTTIIHGYDKINKDIQKDKALKNTIEILTKKITGQ